MHRGLLACLTLLCAACGGGAAEPGPDGDPLSDAEAQALCEDVCMHFVACGWATDMTTCTTGCIDDSQMFRGAGYRAWSECLLASSCSEENAGEACYLEAVDSLGVREVHEQYSTRCAAIQETCPDAALPSGVCDIEEVALFSDAYMLSQVLPCFDLPCGEVAGCLEVHVLDAF